MLLYFNVRVVKFKFNIKSRFCKKAELQRRESKEIFSVVYTYWQFAREESAVDRSLPSNAVLSSLGSAEHLSRFREKTRIKYTNIFKYRENFEISLDLLWDIFVR
jgi:hypothetical protein